MVDWKQHGFTKQNRFFGQKISVLTDQIYRFLVSPPPPINRWIWNDVINEKILTDDKNWIEEN